MRRAVSACLFLLLMVLSSSAQQSRRRPASSSGATTFTLQFMGMNLLSPTRHWPTVPIGSLRPAGTTWGAVESARGNFDWHGVDTWVNAAQAHHVALTYVFLNTPQWASTRPNEKCNRGMNGCAAPPSDEAWQHFVTAVVTRYKGRIDSYEMWNEPNAIGFFSGSAADMAHLMSIAYPLIKSIDPQAIVLSPATSSTGWPTPYDTWLDQFLKAGGGKYVDVIAWHAYAGRTNEPAIPPEDLASQIQKVKAVMAKHGLSNMPLWDTEGGWGKNSQLPDEEAQASFLARWCLIQFSYGIARAYWYQWDNPDYGTLWREGSGETLAGKAYAQVSLWLNGATAMTPCAPAHGSIWTCSMQKGAAKYLVVWSSSGPTTFSDYGGFSSYRELTGEKHPSTGQPVTVDSSPILFQSQ